MLLIIKREAYFFSIYEMSNGIRNQHLNNKKWNKSIKYNHKIDRLLTRDLYLYKILFKWKTTRHLLKKTPKIYKRFIMKNKTCSIRFFTFSSTAVENLNII